jgi:hypothetical protein
VVLLAHPPETVRPGVELPWERSFCRQMIEGKAPRLATVTAAVPAYASRSTGPFEAVAAYVGMPLVTRDGELFGTLCGLSFRAKPRSAARELSVVEAAARMLSTLMAAGMDPPALPDERHPGEPVATGAQPRKTPRARSVSASVQPSGGATTAQASSSWAP